MTSIHPSVNALHASFCSAVGYNFPLTMASERWYLDGHNAGITSSGLAMCVKERKRLNAQGGFQRGLYLRHFLCGEENIANVIEEIAALESRTRIKVMPEARASVLRATGRPDTVPQTDAIPIASVKLLDDLRKAAQ